MKREHEVLLELVKCRKDPVYFAEKYLTVNGQPMVLSPSQKEFLRGISPNTLMAEEYERRIKVILYTIQNSTLEDVGDVIKAIIKDENL